MSDGDALVEALISHQLDLVWIDGSNLARAETRSNGGVVALVQRVGDENIPVHDDHSWTVRAGMDVKLRQKLTDAFLALDRDKAQDKAILDLQRARGFIPAEPARPARPSP